MFRPNTSITSLAIATLLFVATLVLGAAGAVNYLGERDRQLTALRADAVATTNQLEAALALPLWNFDRDQVNKVIESAMQNRQLSGVEVRQEDVASAHGASTYARVRDSHGRVTTTDTVIPAVDAIVTQRDIVADGEKVGTVTVYASPRLVNESLRRSLVSLAEIILALDLILVLSLYRLLSVFALKPLKSVEQYAAAVSSGDRAESDSDGPFVGEIESLRSSIRKMVDLLDVRFAALQKSRVMLAVVLNAVPQAIFWKDRAGVYLGCNEIFAKAVGLGEPDHVAGKTDHDLSWPQDHADAYRSDDAEVIRTGQAKRHIVEPLRQADGVELWVDTTKVPLNDADGHAFGILGVYEDITDRLRTEADLQRYKDHLEELVQQRTTELVEARNEAEAANRAKSGFLANMSHELRTPLNAVLGFSSIMRGDSNLTESQLKTLDIINRSGEHLLGLINDVLDVARIEAGHIALEPTVFDLGGTIRDITDMMRLKAEEKDLDLIFDQSSEFPRFIRADSAKLRQILINLVNNAVKYTDRGSIIVRLRSDTASPSPFQGEGLGEVPKARVDDRVILTFEIEDTGSGIEPGDIDRIFEPFVQVGPAARRKGTGLGLTITRQYVDLMGGTIDVESEVGKGSRFRVVLPVELAGASDLAATEIDRGTVVGLAPGQPQYRVLIVEDQLENAMLMEMLLAAVGFNVKVAENGAIGVDLFKAWKPDFIWMDRRMPVMDGLEAARAIRALPGGRDVKIAALTASAFAGQRQETLEAGMDDFVRKPFRPEEIFDCIARQLGVKYVYAPRVEAAPPAVLTSKTLSGLSDALRQNLMTAVVALDQAQIAEAIGHIAEQDQAAADILSDYADRFAFTAIVKTLQAVE